MTTIQVTADLADRVVGYLLNVEMGYEDYSPKGQQTPSRLEHVVYASYAECLEAQDRFMAWVNSNDKYAGIMNCFPDLYPVLVPAGHLTTNPDAGMQLGRNLFEEHYEAAENTP